MITMSYASKSIPILLMKSFADKTKRPTPVDYDLLTSYCNYNPDSPCYTLVWMQSTCRYLRPIHGHRCFLWPNGGHHCTAHTRISPNCCVLRRVSHRWAVYHTWNIRIPRCCGCAQWYYAYHCIGCRHHVRAYGSFDVYSADYGMFTINDACRFSL